MSTRTLVARAGPDIPGVVIYLGYDPSRCLHEFTCARPGHPLGGCVNRTLTVSSFLLSHPTATDEFLGWLDRHAHKHHRVVEAPGL